jgi:hypothetical protein
MLTAARREGRWGAIDVLLKPVVVFAVFQGRWNFIEDIELGKQSEFEAVRAVVARQSEARRHEGGLHVNILAAEALTITWLRTEWASE